MNNGKPQQQLALKTLGEKAVGFELTVPLSIGVDSATLLRKIRDEQPAVWNAVVNELILPGARKLFTNGNE